MEVDRERFTGIVKALVSQPVERDMVTPDWVEMHCPGCGSVDGQVNANTVNKAFDSNYSHSCGYKGNFEWINPDPPAAYWAARQDQKLHLQVDRHNVDSSSQIRAGRRGSL